MNRITRPIDLQTFRVLATWTLFESEFWPKCPSGEFASRVKS